MRKKKEVDCLMKEVLRQRFKQRSTVKKEVKPILSFDNISSFIHNFNHKNRESRDVVEEEMCFSFPPNNEQQFSQWLLLNDKYIFERNFFIWKQLYMVIERCDLISYIMDGRYPDVYFNEEFHIYLESIGKQVIYILNKRDLIGEDITFPHEHIIFSATDEQYQEDLTHSINSFKNKSVGSVGYPNVGKSSLINKICKKKIKKAKVSKSAGRTKFTQFYKFGNGNILMDCPGLVFRQHEMGDLASYNIINIDNISIAKYYNYILEKIGIERVSQYFKVWRKYRTVEEFYELIKKYNHMDRSVLIIKLIKLKADGLI